MRISISPHNDNVNFEPVEIAGIADFVEYATKYNYSTGTFEDNYRNKANFLGAQAIALDVDNDGPKDMYTIEEAATKFKDYSHIIMPSRSHRKLKNGKVADRFRIIILLESEIDNDQDYIATWLAIQKFYPALDPACKDTSRFFYPSASVYSINENGKTWPVTKYVAPEPSELDVALASGERGLLSRQTMSFLTYGAAPGTRNNKLLKACIDMKEQGFTLEEATAKVAAMAKLSGNWTDTELNAKDHECIANAYKRETKYAPRAGVSSDSVFSFQRLDAMMQEAGDVEWLASDLLSVGGFSMIVGPPKAGKSTLVRQLVKAVCRGERFLDRGVKRGSVLYLTFEEQPAILKEQFDTVGITPEDDVMIHTGAVFDDRAIQHLSDAIKEFSPDLVVLDTIFDIGNLESINNYKEVKDALSRIRAVARETGTHILGVHHTNKMGGFMGSQAIFGAVDTMITFIQQRERRFITSSGKHGTHYDDYEILFEPITNTYTLGDINAKPKDLL